MSETEKMYRKVLYSTGAARVTLAAKLAPAVCAPGMTPLQCAVASLQAADHLVALVVADMPRDEESDGDEEKG